MKKLICIFMSVLLCSGLLAACDKEGAQKSTTQGTATFAESTVTEAATQVYTVEETTEHVTIDSTEVQENKVIAWQFLDAIKMKNVPKIVQLLGAQGDGTQADDVLKNYAFFKDIDLDSYSIENTDTVNRFDITLHISKSGSALFPAGASRWIIEIDSDFFEDGSKIELFAKTNEPITPIYFKQPSDIVGICYEFTQEFGFFKSMDDFHAFVEKVKTTGDKELYQNFCENTFHLLLVAGSEDTMKRDIFEKKVKSLLGITGFDFTKLGSGCVSYDAATDTLTHGGHGVRTYTSTLASEKFDSKTKLHTIAIDYYADTAYLLKAKTVEYQVKENGNGSYSFVSMRLLTDTGIAPIYSADT